MKRESPRHASRRSPTSNRLVLGLVGIVVVGLVAAIATSTSGATPIDEDVVASGAEPRREPPDRVAASAPRSGSVTPEQPRRAELPSGTTVPVVAVSTTDDGTLDVPGDVDVSGWWRGGSRIGDPFGSVLLSAHVDSATQGLGPYVELLTVRPGQSVVLTSAHLRQEYVVRSLRLLDKGPLSDHPWVYSASGPHRLTLVTCAGPFIPSKGGYQQLAVVTAVAVGQPTPREP